MEEQRQETNYTINKITDCIWEVPKSGKMNVPLKIFASEKILDKIKEDRSIQQGINAASLPGILKEAIMLPDAHQGYGFSIGGVAAFDFETGIISPGAIGFDVNCGVRLLGTKLKKEDVVPVIKPLLDELFKNVPSGVGRDSTLRLTHEELDKFLMQGAHYAVERGFGVKEDLDVCEESGQMQGADSKMVTPTAKARGKGQLGTLGAGNHFLEVQYVDEIFDKEAAAAFGFHEKGQVAVMVHTGSRGLGHQVCSDYLRKMEETFPEICNALPDRDLIYAPASSKLAKEYYAAMVAAANFAWSNRHIIGHYIRKSVQKFFPNEEVFTVYDVAHNIAKVEEHMIDGEKRKVYLHRKGATRAFPAGSVEIPQKYRDVGQPILIPGSMGTASYVLVGTQTSMEQSFGSTAHGAGRVMSRFAATKQFKAEDVKKDLESHGIFIRSASLKGITEEAPGVYKDVDEVVKVSHDAGIGKLVVRLKPLGVMKG